MIRVEFYKQVHRVRTYVLLFIIAAFPALLTLIFRVARPAPPASAEHAGDDLGFIVLASSSGLNMAIATLGHAGDVILPIVGVILAGSAVAEEANWGTLGYLLVRPVSRRRLVASKLLVISALMVAATALAVLFAVADGVVAFGWQAVETPAGATIPAGAALARIAMATPYIAWSLAGVISLGFFVSSVSSSSLNGAAAAFGLAAVSQILNSLPVLGDARYVLPTHYWRAWESLLVSPAKWSDMAIGAAVQLPYVIVFLALTWWFFKRRDIVS